MSTVDEIRNQALRLSQHDRAALARDLIVSLDAEGIVPDSDSVWAEEIEARSNAVAQGEFMASEWRDSIKRIRQVLAQRPAR